MPSVFHEPTARWSPDAHPSTESATSMFRRGGRSQRRRTNSGQPVTGPGQHYRRAAIREARQRMPAQELSDRFGIREPVPHRRNPRLGHGPDGGARRRRRRWPGHRGHIAAAGPGRHVTKQRSAGEPGGPAGPIGAVVPCFRCRTGRAADSDNQRLSAVTSVFVQVRPSAILTPRRSCVGFRVRV